jgi:hypothetical protein
LSFSFPTFQFLSFVRICLWWNSHPCYWRFHTYVKLIFLLHLSLWVSKSIYHWQNWTFGFFVAICLIILCCAIEVLWVQYPFFVLKTFKVFSSFWKCIIIIYSHQTVK